jgi:tetratricopeptide (TPR) repeat protein
LYRRPHGTARADASVAGIGVVMIVLLLATVLALPVQASATAQPPAAASARAEDLEALFKSATDLQAAGQFEAAAAAYRRFLESQPRNVEALSNLGVVLVQLARYDEAIACYRKALEISYRNVPIRMNLALAYYKAGRCADAIPEFDSVLGTNPGQPNVTLLKGDCLVQLGEYAAAVALLEPLEPTLGTERVFNYVYGMALLQAKQTAAGLAQIDRILKDGDAPEAHLMLGLSHRTAGDYAAARDEFKKAVDANPDLPLAHSLYGQALLSTGDRDLATQAFEAELRKNPGDFDSNLYMGVILKEDSQLDAAERYFARALQLRPGDPGVRYQLATVHVGRLENDKALAILEPLVKESPDFIEARVSLATVYYRLKRREDGDRERAAVAELNKAAQARQPTAETQGTPIGQSGAAPPLPGARPPQ